MGIESVLDLNEVEQMFEDVEKDSQGYARVADLAGLDSSGSHMSSSLAQSVDLALGLGAFTTNAERIISALASVKKKYLAKDDFLSGEIDFAIERIRKQDIYAPISTLHCESPELMHFQKTDKGRDYVSFL